MNRFFSAHHKREFSTKTPAALFREKISSGISGIDPDWFFLISLQCDMQSNLFHHRQKI
jgi:hypothetical protein